MAGGQLESGEQLPSVRDLSAQLHLNPLTVAKVYQFLEREGLVETRRGLGTFVAERARILPPAERRKQLQPALRQLVAEALHLGVEEDDLQALLKRTFDEMKSSKRKPNP